MKNQQYGLATLLLIVFVSGCAHSPKALLPSLDKVPAGQVVGAYSRLSHRTFVAGPGIDLEKQVTIVLPPDASVAKAMKLIKVGLAQDGIILQESGKKYLFVISPSQRRPLPKIIEEPPVKKEEVNDRMKRGEVVPLINFWGMTFSQTVSFYIELTGRRQGRVPNLANPFIYMSNAAPLTKREAISLLEAAFALHGFQILPEGDRGLKVLQNGKPVPMREIHSEIHHNPANSRIIRLPPSTNGVVSPR